MKTTTFRAILFSYLLFITACSKKDATPEPCLGVSYVIDYFKTESIGGANNGSIAVNYPIGDTITYKLNNGTYQVSRNFTNLAPGSYTLMVKNQKECTDTTQITIHNYGPKYALVKQIIVGYCGPCHYNGGMEGGKNFDSDASVVANWDRIKARAVDNIPSQMPLAPNAPLTAVDKQKITNWVNAGHRQSD
ncbi:MAG: hypothetical protein ABIT35_06905 [Chitinophagaceae bacterium]